MDRTIVRMKCVSKKERKNYQPERPIHTTIELEVPYDQNSIFFKMSGGTNFELQTVNQEAADMFKLGNDYDVVISQCEE